MLTAARHRAFIAPRLLGSIIGLASFPVYLIIRGTPSAVELMIFAWLVVPISTAYFLSRTGQYERAHILSSFALTALVTAVAFWTGGIASFAAIWLVVVPLEAALSASRRIVAIASTFSLGAAGLLVLAGSTHVLPIPNPGDQATLAAFGIVSAALYAAGLALGAEAHARTSFWMLHAEEDRYRLLARNITDVITRHGRNGAVVFMSPAAESVFGCRVADLTGHGLFDRVHVADRPAYLTALGDAAALGEDRSVEFRVRREMLDDSGRPTSQFVWIEMRCRPLEEIAVESGDRHPQQEVVAVLRDVTERKHHQQALQEAHAEVERDNARKGRFLATMSHELRTPLNAIIGFSDMLKNEAELMLDAKQRTEYSSLINESGRHLLSVVNDILEISKIETDKLLITTEPFAPAQVVRGCCDLLAPRVREAGVHIEKYVADDLPEMIADKRALNQILLNLLSNAIRFTDRGGRVKISALAEAAAIKFTVEDTGVGISDEDLARVGEPYFQAGAPYDRRHGGTGLGLSIVKGLVRLHGGEFDIRSRLGQGTRVTVLLPLDCDRARTAKAQSGQAPVDLANRLPNLANVSAIPLAAHDTSSPRNDILVKKRA